MARILQRLLIGSWRRSAAALALLTLFICVETRSAAALTDPYLATLQEFLAIEKLDGGVLLVSRPGFRHIVAAGVADRRSGRKVTPETRFYVASISKVAVAASILQQAEQGKADLDAHARDLAPDLPLQRIPNAGAATLRQLLNHTSGAPDYLVSDQFTEASFRDMERRWTAAEVLAYAQGLKATHKLGQGYEYSNTNYVIAGHIAGRNDNSTLAEVLQRRVLAPAGMTRTTIGADAREPDLAHGWADPTESGRPRDVSLASWNMTLGDGMLVTTAADLEKLLTGILRDGKVLKPDSVRLMTTPTRYEENYGMGLELEHDRWGRIWGHTGRYDGFEAEAWFYPDQNGVIVFMTNGNQESERSIADLVAPTLFANTAAGAPVWTVIPPAGTPVYNDGASSRRRRNDAEATNEEDEDRPTPMIARKNRMIR